MKVKYFHVEDPEVEKIHDTVRSLKGGLGIIKLVFGDKKTQEEWDKEELQRFERDLKKGLILSYEVIKED